MPSGNLASWDERSGVNPKVAIAPDRDASIAGAGLRDWAGTFEQLAGHYNRLIVKRPRPWAVSQFGSCGMFFDIGPWEVPMEKTLADIEADIASLRENLTKYRKLAEEHRAADNVMIAKKLMDLVVDLEARVAELEALKVRAIVS
jgi:hypothetical protein